MDQPPQLPSALHRSLIYTDEAVTSPLFIEPRSILIRHLERSVYWSSIVRLSEFERLLEIATLQAVSNPHFIEPPNQTAITLGARILKILEASGLTADRVTPSLEGGIALLFFANRRRSIIEIDNEGGLTAATYGDTTEEPVVWELLNEEASIASAAEQIRVHLTA